MEVIDDWKPAAARPGPSDRTADAAAGTRHQGSAAASARPSARMLADRLAGLDPPVLVLHCYEDVGLRWIELTFDAEAIAPALALGAADRLVAGLGQTALLFSALRPRAALFVLDESGFGGEPAIAGDDALPASRYGIGLDALRRHWNSGPAR